MMYADLSLSNASKMDKIVGLGEPMGGFGVLANLGGEILSNFRYESSMNQSKILLTASHLSSLSSHLSSINSRFSNDSKIRLKTKESMMSHKKLISSKQIVSSKKKRM